MTLRRLAYSAKQRQTVKGKIAALLERRNEILFVVVHGSFEEGFPFEDVDVAVYLAEPLQSRDRFETESELALELEKRVGLPVDVQILNGASLGFQYAVSSGELLFTRNPTAFYDFRERVWLTYLDHKYFYEQSLADLLKS